MVYLDPLYQPFDQQVIDCQPKHIAARVYQARSMNKLYVLKNKLVPLISTKFKKTTILADLKKLKNSDSKFKKGLIISYIKTLT